MKYTVIFHDDFEPEYNLLPADVQDELFARIAVLEQFGPSLGRPTVDTLTASSFANMKEIRFNCDGVWRFALHSIPTARPSFFVVETKKRRSEEVLQVADRNSGCRDSHPI